MTKKVVMRQVLRDNKAARRSAVAPDDDTKQTLLAATADILCERPSLEFTLAEVGKRAQLSAALVQYHFGSKIGLLHALLESSSTNYVRQINGLIDMDMSAIDKLRLHVRAIVATYTKTPYLDRLLHLLIDTSTEEEAKRISDFYVRRVVDFYGRLIDQGVREGVFRPIDPMHLYFILLGTADHLSARRRVLEPMVGETGFDMDFARAFGDSFYRIVLDGIRATAD